MHAELWPSSLSEGLEQSLRELSLSVTAVHQMPLCEFQALLNYINEEKYWFLQIITNISSQVFISVVEVIAWISILAMLFNGNGWENWV